MMHTSQNTRHPVRLLHVVLTMSLFMACTADPGPDPIVLPDSLSDDVEALDVSAADANVTDTNAPDTGIDVLPHDADTDDASDDAGLAIDGSGDTAIHDAIPETTEEDTLPPEDAPNDLSSADSPVQDTAIEDATLPLIGTGLTCEEAFQIVVLPFEHASSTVGGGNAYGYEPGSCPGETGGWGSGSQDHVFTFTPLESATYTMTLTADFDSTLYAVTDCSDLETSCLAAIDEIGLGATETLVLPLTQGETTYFIVDGYGNSSDKSGTYVFSVSAACLPACVEGSCDNGCGGTCPCGDGTSCNVLSGLCEGAVGGNTCAQAAPVVGLPYTAIGNTENPALPFADSYSVPGFVCDGLPNGAGYGSKDAVFRITPTETTELNFIVQPADGFDAAIYIVTDCQATSGTCLGGLDEAGPGAPESLNLMVEAGAPYFVIVDGAGPSTGGAFALKIALSCEPACTSGSCGSDGCGGICECGDGATCVEETCCNPDCDGVTCGPDACGGTCACAPGTTCESGTEQCVDAQAGDQCANAFPFATDALPATVSGDTTSFLNDYHFEDNECPGSAMGFGAGSPDTAHAFTAPQGGIYTFTLTPQGGFDAALYALDGCGASTETCLEASEVVAPVGAPAESISLNIDQGDTVHLIVDGYSNSTPIVGAYDLSVSAPCAPQCTAGLCGGNDGCGGVCGCGAGMVCHPATQACSFSQGGDTCGEASAAGALSVAAGDTQWASDSYGVDPGVCPGIDGDGGYGSADHAYIFSADESGVYPISVESEFDAVLYAVKNCADVANSCAAGSDDVGAGQTESLFLSIEAGDTHFIIVDGYGLGSDGVYLLNIGPVCLPQCALGSCASNGCGGLCQCPGGQTCAGGSCQ